MCRFDLLKGANIVKEHFNVAKEFSENVLRLCDSVVGIVFLGGIGRGYSDKLSDVDIIIYAEKPCENIPKGEFRFKDFLFDVDMVELEEELKSF